MWKVNRGDGRDRRSKEEREAIHVRQFRPCLVLLDATETRLPSIRSVNWLNNGLMGWQLRCRWWALPYLRGGCHRRISIVLQRTAALLNLCNYCQANNPGDNSHYRGPKFVHPTTFHFFASP
uniref:Uncharacterized protein n=1 Tax=Echinococcus granulosus TaxID=6210 RepID=A0A068WT94_ECHGR|nr:hypothetical protein EgrG_000526500 [Echinococcus granulosus]